MVSISLYGNIFDISKSQHVVTMFKDIKVNLLFHKKTKIASLFIVLLISLSGNMSLGD